MIYFIDIDDPEPVYAECVWNFAIMISIEDNQRCKGFPNSIVALMMVLIV